MTGQHRLRSATAERVRVPRVEERGDHRGSAVRAGVFGARPARPGRLDRDHRRAPIAQHEDAHPDGRDGADDVAAPVGPARPATGGAPSRARRAADDRLEAPGLRDCRAAAVRAARIEHRQRQRLRPQELAGSRPQRRRIERPQRVRGSARRSSSSPAIASAKPSRRARPSAPSSPRARSLASAPRARSSSVGRHLVARQTQRLVDRPLGRRLDPARRRRQHEREQRAVARLEGEPVNGGGDLAVVAKLSRAAARRPRA